MPRPLNRGMNNPNAKLSRWQVSAIRKKWDNRQGLKGKYRLTMQQIAEQYGVSRATISGILSRKNWKLLS